MILKDLLEGIEVLNANADLNLQINNIVTDSRKVIKDDVFVALKGQKDGHNFCSEALKNGAKVIISQRKMSSSLPYLQVKDTRVALALMAANYYNNAHKKMKIIFVVGTNG